MKTLNDWNGPDKEREVWNADLRELNEQELAQVAGGMSGEKYHAVTDKLLKLQIRKLITRDQAIEIRKQAQRLDEKAYSIWATDYAAKHGLDRKDIMP